MDYATPIGKEAEGEAATYIDGNPEAGIEGSAVPAKAIEPGMRELIHLIRFAGLTPSGTDMEQVRKAVSVLIESAAPGLATLLQPGLVMPDGTTITIDAAGKLSVVAASKYEIGEFYYFRHPTLKSGMQPAQGGLIANAEGKYPQIWAYLQTADGQLLCKTEAEWQALTSAAGWNGIGGAPFYVQNLGAGTLRMPDLRGMVPEAAGFESLAVGGVHLDAVKAHSHGLRQQNDGGNLDVQLSGTGYNYRYVTAGGNAPDLGEGTLLTGITTNRVRAFGSLACAFLGTPQN